MTELDSTSASDAPAVPGAPALSNSAPDAPDAPGLRVTVQDIRAARYCLAGVRPWFRRHGFDWQAFLAQGIEAAVLRATGDALIEPVLVAAAARTGAAMSAADPSSSAHRRSAPHRSEPHS